MILLTRNCSAYIWDLSQSSAREKTSHCYRPREYNLSCYCINFIAICRRLETQASWGWQSSFIIELKGAIPQNPFSAGSLFQGDDAGACSF